MRSVVTEMGGYALVRQTLAWQVVGFVLLICHVLLVRQSVYFYPMMVGVMTWLYYRSPFGGLLVWFQVLIYQNLIISIFSEHLDYTSFTALQGTNFVLLAFMSIIAFFRLLPMWRSFRMIVIVMAFAMLCAVIYMGIGAVKSGPTSALVYFRQVSGPMLAALIGIDAGRVWGYRTMATALLYSAIPCVLISVYEFCFPLAFYQLIDEVRYYQLKYFIQTESNTFYVPEDIISHFTAVFFNITNEAAGAWMTYRFGGTIINPVSNAYVLSILGLIAISVRRSGWLAVLVPLLFLVGVKGASILLAGGLLLYLLWLSVRNVQVLTLLGLGLAVCYLGFGIYTGLQNYDYHVMGFMGGLKSLISTPWGHGLGVGGNLSAQANAGFRWEGRGGFRSGSVDFAVESAVGVMAYQMGAAALVVIGVFLTFLWKAPLGRTRFHAVPVRSDIMFFGLFVVTLNGVFQEEAYAPYAAGLLMLLCGILIGNARRQGVVLATIQRLHGRRRWNFA